ncbi:hypothetical protein Mapa_008419 [Marchantia paleacea]|nr:hypothetical protein Mapa_008419 [Marchantia paleacea]
MLTSIIKLGEISMRFVWIQPYFTNIILRDISVRFCIDPALLPHCVENVSSRIRSAPPSGCARIRLEHGNLFPPGELIYFKRTRHCSPACQHMTLTGKSKGIRLRQVGNRALGLSPVHDIRGCSRFPVVINRGRMYFPSTCEMMRNPIALYGP